MRFSPFAVGFLEDASPQSRTEKPPSHAQRERATRERSEGAGRPLTRRRVRLELRQRVRGNPAEGNECGEGTMGVRREQGDGYCVAGSATKCNANYRTFGSGPASSICRLKEAW